MGGGGVELLSSRALFQVCPHILSLFMIPSNVANWLEKLQWDFLLVGLGEGEESSVDRLEASDTTCENRILGIKKLSTFKHALLGKWHWCFTQEKGHLWRCVVSIKYGEQDGDGHPKKYECQIRVGLSKGTRAGWESFYKLIRFRIGGVFGGRGIVDVLKILRDLFRTSSFSFLEL